MQQHWASITTMKLVTIIKLTSITKVYLSASNRILHSEMYNNHKIKTAKRLFAISFTKFW